MYGKRICMLQGSTALGVGAHMEVRRTSMGANLRRVRSKNEQGETWNVLGESE